MVLEEIGSNHAIDLREHQRAGRAVKQAPALQREPEAISSSICGLSALVYRGKLPQLSSLFFLRRGEKNAGN